MEVMLLGEINVRLWGPQDTREEDLATALTCSGLVGMTSHFVPRRWYRGVVIWM